MTRTDTQWGSIRQCMVSVWVLLFLEERGAFALWQGLESVHKRHAILELLQSLLQLGGLLRLGAGAVLGLQFAQAAQAPFVEVVAHVGADLVQRGQDVDEGCDTTKHDTQKKDEA